MRDWLLLKSKKGKKLLCVIFLLFPTPILSVLFLSPPPPSLPAGSPETKGEKSRKVGVMSQGKPTPLNIQNIEYEMSEELSILL